MHGEHNHGRTRLFALGNERSDGFGRDKRTVAGKHHERAFGDGAIGLSERLATSVDGVARAELLRLDGDFCIAPNKRGNLLGHVAQNRHDVFDTGVMGGVNHPAHERLSKHFVDDLRFIGFHAGAGTRSKNQRFRGHGNLLRIRRTKPARVRQMGKVYQRTRAATDSSTNAHASGRDGRAGHVPRRKPPHPKLRCLWRKRQMS